MRFTEVIAQDHAAVRRGLNILDRMVQRMEEATADRNFRYPYGDQISSSLWRPLPARPMCRNSFGAIEASLSPKHGVGFVRSSRQLIQLLRNQIDQEQVRTRCGRGSRKPDAITESPMTTFARLERKYAPKPRSSSN